MKTFAALSIVVLAAAAPASAQSREQRQMMADIRMLQQQAQELQVAIATLTQTLQDQINQMKTINPRIDANSDAMRKGFADQKVIIDDMGKDLRAIRERVDDTNVRVSNVREEIDALRNSIVAPPVSAAPQVPVGDPNAPQPPVPRIPTSSNAGIARDMLHSPPAHLAGTGSTEFVATSMPGCCRVEISGGIGRRMQELAHLFVARLVEVVVPLSHRGERLGHTRADHLVRHAFQIATGLAGANGHRDDQPRRRLVLRCLYGRPHRRSGGEPIVNEDHRATSDVDGRLVASVLPFSAHKLCPLAGRDRFDVFRGHPVPAHDIIVEHLDTARRNRSHREFGMAWCTELANEKNVERGADRVGHDTADGDAAAW